MPPRGPRVSDYGTIVDSLNIDTAVGNYARKRMPENDRLDVYAAREIETDLEAVILEVAADSFQGIDDWPRSEVFELRPRSNPD